jgi:hypothetical protein
LERLAPIPVAQAVTTDLTPAKSVTVAPTVPPVENDTSSNSANYQHTVILDPETQELIFRLVDVRSRQVVRQSPEEALLRMRAYARALADGKSETEALNQANIEV